MLIGTYVHKIKDIMVHIGLSVRVQGEQREQETPIRYEWLFNTKGYVEILFHIVRIPFGHNHNNNVFTHSKWNGPSHNIIQIHNNVSWDWQYYIEYSRIFFTFVSNKNLVGPPDQEVVIEWVTMSMCDGYEVWSYLALEHNGVLPLKLPRKFDIQ